jgi:hypothetical protein
MEVMGMEDTMKVVDTEVVGTEVVNTEVVETVEVGMGMEDTVAVGDTEVVDTEATAMDIVRKEVERNTSRDDPEAMAEEAIRDTKVITNMKK